MPFVRGPAKAEEVSWDQFPAPAPELDTWKPDPDSIPVAGNLPDPRFNKDPLVEQLRLARKRDKLLFGNAVDRYSEGPSTSSPQTTRTATPLSIGRWPAPVPRAAAPPSSAFQSMPHETAVTADTHFMPPKPSLNATYRTGTNLKLADGVEGTMEMLAVKPPFSKAPSPPTSVSLPVDESQDDNDIPAWARPLENLLQVSSMRPSLPSQATPVPQQVVAMPPASTPPHLRQRGKETSTTTTVDRFSAASNRLHSTTEGGSGQQEHIVEPAKPTRPFKDVQLQKTLLESLISGHHFSLSHTHQRYLQTKLINIMEDEMDTEGRMTRRELHAMADNEFESHFARTVSRHERTWNKKTKVDTGERT